jgi:polysaccharide export outer membrane protein
MKMVNGWRRKLLLPGAMGFLFILSIGCASTEPARFPTQAYSPRDPDPEITLGSGDVLDVKFYYAPELNESQMVRPNGKISLQLIGEVDVQGKTPAQLRQELIGFYKTQLRRPEVAVIVRSLNNRRVYVGGEVKKPSLIPIPGRLTALEAIMQVGGFNMATAELSNVIIIREHNGKFEGRALDFKEILRGKPVPMVALQPRDIVYVPRTKIVELNQWIDQYITRMIPNVAVTWLYNTGTRDSTIGVSGSR